MTSNLEDALTLPEMELIARIFNPLKRITSNIEYGGPEAELADSIHQRLAAAIRRQRFHGAVAERSGA